MTPRESYRNALGRTAIAAAVAAAALATPPWSYGYLAQQRWGVTASGYTYTSGLPITLTWSLPPDGATTTGSGAGSPINNLVGTLDAAFDVEAVSADLTTRPWFPLFESSLRRWSEVSGVRLVYEPNDDGAHVGPSAGVLGVRGDVRIGGRVLNGPGGALALSNFPDSGDILLDTADIAYLTYPANNYLRLRNVLMHEVGHALGLGHIESIDSDSLLEPQLNLAFDGPQLDDIRGVHWMYGDANERANGGRGNGAPSLATALGLLSPATPLAIGVDAAKPGALGPQDRDFVSITNSSDRDVYAFTIDEPLRAEISLTPLGGTYRQGLPGGPQSLIDAAARNNLQFDLLVASDAAGGEGIVATADSAPAGGADRLSIDLLTPGDYFVRVSGSFHAVQLYQLELSASSLSEPAGPLTPEPSGLMLAATIALTTASCPQPNRCGV